MDKLSKVVVWLRAAAPYQKTFDSISRAAGVNAHTLRKIRSGETKDPSFKILDALVSYVEELEKFAEVLEIKRDVLAAMRYVTPAQLRLDRLENETERFEYLAEIVRMCSIVRNVSSPGPAVNPQIAEASSAGSDA